ncbi:MAG: hypothetical protein WBC05_25150 [Sedimentisphaerales bacterium]
MKHYRRLAFFILISAYLAHPVFGCAVPVFRYALERWAPDAYEAVIIHRGPLDDDPASSLLKGDEVEFLNLRISTMDLETSAENEVTSLLGGAVPETLPALAIWYPWQKGRATPFWTGEFTPAAVKALIQSPKRRQLAQRLTDGQTAVWVVVESGNAAKDKAAMQMLDQQLATATKELKEMAPELAEELEMPGLSYKFSTLTISRSDPQERMLLEMLLKSEPDLGDYADEPIVFPVFGRARALYALASEGINADTIRETIAFLTGPCGCEIKMLNPGVDLLMAVNWDAAVMQFYQEFYETLDAGTAEESLPELTGVFPEEQADAGLDAQGELVAAAISESTQPLSAAVETPKRKIRGFGVVGMTAVSLAAILIAAGLGTLAVTRRKI